MTSTVEMAPLVRDLRDVTALLGPAKVRELAGADVQSFANDTGFVVRGRGRPSIVIGTDVGLELGHPRTSSRSFVATTCEHGLVVDGRMTLYGPDLDDLEHGATSPFGQVVLLAVAAGTEPDLFAIENTQLLTNRLPGYMVRSVPGRLWVRVSRKVIDEGMRFETVATALWAAFHIDFEEVTGVEAVFVTGRAEDVERLAPLALEARARSGRHKKLVITREGELECNEGTCAQCDERDVCDAAREILRERMTGRGG